MKHKVIIKKNKFNTFWASATIDGYDFYSEDKDINKVKDKFLVEYNLQESDVEWEYKIIGL